MRRSATAAGQPRACGRQSKTARVCLFVRVCVQSALVQPLEVEKNGISIKNIKGKRAVMNLQENEH